MFHVERQKQTYMNKRITALFCIFILLSSCNVSRQTVQIPDYILVPNGKEILGNKGLNAFLFENNTKNLTIEKYLSMKFKGENYFADEYWITIEKNKYKLIVYTNDEFEKYFNSANYSVINLEPENANGRCSLDRTGPSASHAGCARRCVGPHQHFHVHVRVRGVARRLQPLKFALCPRTCLRRIFELRCDTTRLAIACHNRAIFARPCPWRGGSPAARGPLSEPRNQTPFHRPPGSMVVRCCPVRV